MSHATVIGTALAVPPDRPVVAEVDTQQASTSLVPAMDWPQGVVAPIGYGDAGDQLGQELGQTPGTVIGRQDSTVFIDVVGQVGIDCLGHTDIIAGSPIGRGCRSDPDAMGQTLLWKVQGHVAPRQRSPLFLPNTQRIRAHSVRRGRTVRAAVPAGLFDALTNPLRNLGFQPADGTTSQLDRLGK